MRTSSNGKSSSKLALAMKQIAQANENIYLHGLDKPRNEQLLAARAVLTGLKNVIQHGAAHLLQFEEAMKAFKAATPAPATRALYSFRFRPEGFNSVWACTTAEAIAAAKKEFPCLTVDETSFIRRDTKAAQDAYWDNLPLMD